MALGDCVRGGFYQMGLLSEGPFVGAPFSVSSAQCIEKGRQEDNFVYRVNTYLWSCQTLLVWLVIRPVNVLDISQHLGSKIAKIYDENVLLLTHCASAYFYLRGTDKKMKEEK